MQSYDSGCVPWYKSLQIVIARGRSYTKKSQKQYKEIFDNEFDDEVSNHEQSD